MRLIYLLIISIFICPLQLWAQIDDSLSGKPSALLLSKLIQIRSISGNEGNVGRYLTAICIEKGLHTKVFTESDSAYNLAASLYPLSSNKKNIVFISHIDVVPANDSSDWKYSPFSGAIKENAVWGRGAVDCKGLLVMQLLAITHYIDYVKKNDLPYNFTLLMVSGEETNGDNGSQIISEKFMKELHPAVIFGEGGSGMRDIIPSYPNQTVFGISLAEKSSLWLKLETKTKNSGHGAAPPELYANKRLLRALIRLMDEKRYARFDKLTQTMFRSLGRMEGGLKGFVIRHINWEILWPFVKKYFREGEPFYILAYNTYVITNISNPAVSNNQIANNASAVLDCRLLPETDPKKFIKKIKNTVGQKVSVTVISESPSSVPSDRNIFYDDMENAIISVFPGSKVVPILFPATTDNNFFRNKNIPVYGILPVVFSQTDLEMVHGVNEKINIEDLEKGIRVYEKFIEEATKKQWW